MILRVLHTWIVIKFLLHCKLALEIICIVKNFIDFTCLFLMSSRIGRIFIQLFFFFNGDTIVFNTHGTTAPFLNRKSMEMIEYLSDKNHLQVHNKPTKFYCTSCMELLIGSSLYATEITYLFMFLVKRHLSPRVLFESTVQNAFERNKKFPSRFCYLE